MHSLRSFVDDRDRNRIYDIHHVAAWAERENGKEKPVPAWHLALYQAASNFNAAEVARERLAALHQDTEPKYATHYEYEAARSAIVAYKATLDLVASSLWFMDHGYRDRDKQRLAVRSGPKEG